jgi:hypothetical protein
MMGMISGQAANQWSAFNNPGWEIAGQKGKAKSAASMLPELPKGYIWEACRVQPQIGAIFIPGKHKPYFTSEYSAYLNATTAMKDFYGKVTFITAHHGWDSAKKETVSIDADGGLFRYRWVHGWILKKDGVVVLKDALESEVQFYRQAVPVGLPDCDLLGDQADGVWEYYGGTGDDLDPSKGEEFILGPYGIFPCTPAAAGDNVLAQYPSDLDATGQAPRTSWAVNHASAAYVGKRATVRERTMLSYTRDWIDREVVEVDVGNETFYWRVESLIQRVTEYNINVQNRQELRAAKKENVDLRAEVEILKEKLEKAESTVASMTATLAAARKKLEEHKVYQDLYRSVQRLLTRYFLNGELSTSDQADARVLENLAQRYRAVRSAVTEARKESDNE